MGNVIVSHKKIFSTSECMIFSLKKENNPKCSCTGSPKNAFEEDAMESAVFVAPKGQGQGGGVGLNPNLMP